MRSGLRAPAAGDGPVSSATPCLFSAFSATRQIADSRRGRPPARAECSLDDVSPAYVAEGPRCSAHRFCENVSSFAVVDKLLAKFGKSVSPTTLVWFELWIITTSRCGNMLRTVATSDVGLRVCWDANRKVFRAQALIRTSFPGNQWSSKTGSTCR